MQYHFVLVTIVKDEAWYIAEWIAFHITQGVDHFFIYNNDSSDATLDVIQRFPSDMVTLIDFPGKGVQLDAYVHFLRHFGSSTKYCAMIDADEFLYFRNGTRVEELMGSLDSSGVALNWSNYGSSGHIRRPSALGIEAFTMRAELGHAQNDSVKCIYRASDIRTPEMHISLTKNGIIDLAGLPVHSNGHLTSTPDPAVELRHYSIKSLSSFCKKVARQSAYRPYNPAPLSYFLERDTNRIADPLPPNIIRAVQNVLLKYGIDENLFLSDCSKFDLIATALHEGSPKYKDSLRQFSFSESEAFSYSVLFEDAGNDSIRDFFVGQVSEDAYAFMRGARHFWRLTMSNAADEQLLAYKADAIALYSAEKNSALILRELLPALHKAHDSNSIDTILGTHSPETFDSAALVARLGDFAQDCNRLDFAAACYRQATVLSPHISFYSSRYANILAALARYQECLAEIDRYRANNFAPEKSVLDAEGRAAHACGQLERARDIVTKLITYGEHDALYTYRLSTIYFDLKQLNMAAELASRASVLRPDSTNYAKHAENLNALAQAGGI